MNSNGECAKKTRLSSYLGWIVGLEDVQKVCRDTILYNFDFEGSTTHSFFDVFKKFSSKEI